MIDKKKLTEYDLELFEEIIRRHPEWLKFAHQYYEDYIDLDVLDFRIPCPFKINPNIIIEIYGLGDAPKIWLAWGEASIQDYWTIFGISTKEKIDVTPQLSADFIEKMVGGIMTEKYIATRYRTPIWIPNNVLLDLEKFKSLKKNRILNSISWLGTYNYNYDGAYGNSYSDDKSTN